MIAGQDGHPRTAYEQLSKAALSTPEMAVRLGKFCGNGPGLWLPVRQAYDLWHAERQLRSELEKIPGRGVAA